MSVESVTQSVSNLALRFSEDDEEDEDGMVGWADGVGAVSEERSSAVTFRQPATARAARLELPCSWQGWMKVAHICSTWILQGPSQSSMQKL